MLFVSLWATCPWMQKGPKVSKNSELPAFLKSLYILLKTADKLLWTQIMLDMSPCHTFWSACNYAYIGFFCLLSFVVVVSFFFFLKMLLWGAVLGFCVDRQEFCSGLFAKLCIQAGMSCEFPNAFSPIWQILLLLFSIIFSQQHFQLLYPQEPKAL